MHDKEKLTLTDTIDFLRFELDRCYSKNEDLTEQLKNAFKEIDTLQEKISSILFKPIDEYIAEATDDITATTKIEPFSYVISFKLPERIFLTSKYKIVMKNDILNYFHQYLDEKVLPEFKLKFEKLLLRIMDFKDEN
jgi:FtsZ-binding cell division protein ZapB